jgi:hypothetical protein
MVLGYAIGGVLFVGGVPLGLFGPKAETKGDAVASCPDAITTDLTCSDRMFSADGKTYTWTVAAEGTYVIELKQPNVARPIDGVIEVTDATGAKVAYDDGGSASKNARVDQAFRPGTYKVNVRDFAHDKVEGGYGFQLTFAHAPKATPSAPEVASATPAASSNALVAPHAAGHAGTTPHATTPPKEKPAHK